MITQIPGGAIATIFPANRLFGIAVGGSALCNLLVPVACKGSYGVVAFIRVLQGLVEGTSYPACHGIWRYWAPPIERSRLATTAFCATLGLIWFGVWWKTSYEKPSTHPKISAEERDYIEESIGEVDIPPSLTNLKTTFSGNKSALKTVLARAPRSRLGMHLRATVPLTLWGGSFRTGADDNNNNSSIHDHHYYHHG
ncbi:unnamed protein product [Mesocestoides corti]|uniref:Major facilitator superfamily (MFS) profile domain-containing protein n=1 Tax=Mesocestoides corti TaxID=53468 RepID=A0A0R3UBP4_MESCO|nr:unnamed protein product [Mesocestoides corti]